MDIVRQLRGEITAQQRALLDHIWHEHRSSGKPLARRLLERTQGGPTHVRGLLGALGGSVVCANERCGNDPSCYRVTLLGALLTSDGEALEGALAEFLALIRKLTSLNPGLAEIGAVDLAASRSMSTASTGLIHAALRLVSCGLNWGGSFGHDKWIATLPDDIDEVLESQDLRLAVRRLASANYAGDRPIEPRAMLAYAQASSNVTALDEAFWFVSGAALRKHIAGDWREAQLAFQSECWKSCILLCGAVAEGMLHDAICVSRDSAREDAPVESAVAYTLNDLLREAKNRRVLRGAAVTLGHALREYRNLIHPERQLALSITICEREAEIALTTVEILRDMVSDWRRAANAINR